NHRNQGERRFLRIGSDSRSLSPSPIWIARTHVRRPEHQARRTTVNRNPVYRTIRTAACADVQEPFGVGRPGEFQPVWAGCSGGNQGTWIRAISVYHVETGGNTLTRRTDVCDAEAVT